MCQMAAGEEDTGNSLRQMIFATGPLWTVLLGLWGTWWGRRWTLPYSRPRHLLFIINGHPSRTLGKKTGLPLHFHLWATFTVRQTLRIQFSNSAGVINNSGTELGQKIKVKYDMNDLVTYHLHWPPPTRTCGLRNSIFRALHMCIGADLNQDHFSRPRFSITHAKPWTLLFLSAPSFVFLLSWPPKKKKLFFSTVSLNGVGGGSSFERKKKQKKESMEKYSSVFTDGWVKSEAD